MRFRPNWYLLVTVVSWGLNFVAVKEVYRQMPAPALGLLRFLVMWVSLVLVCLVRRESLRFPRGDALRLIYLGFISMGVYMVAFLEGMHGSAATEGSILFQLSPVFTALLSAALGQERFSLGSLTGGLVALAGTGLIVYSPHPDGANKVVSNLVVIVAAMLWAYAVTVMRPLLVKYSPLRVLTLSMVGGFPVMLIYGFSSARALQWSAITPYTWLMFFHISIISGVVAFLCFYQGVRQVGGSGATLYQFFVPGVAVVCALMIQGTVPTVAQLMGLVVVLLGVGYALRARSQAQASTEPAAVNSLPNEVKTQG